GEDQGVDFVAALETGQGLGRVGRRHRRARSEGAARQQKETEQSHEWSSRPHPFPSRYCNHGRKRNERKSDERDDGGACAESGSQPVVPPPSSGEGMEPSPW